MRLIYEEDARLPLRESHRNPEIARIYDEFLKAPLSSVGRKLLHTHYEPRALDYSKFIDTSDSELVAKHLLARGFPSRRPEFVVEMLLSESDRANYVSPGAVVSIALHSGLKPIEVLSIQSSFRFMPRQPPGEAVLYVCSCANCELRGAGAALARLQSALKAAKARLSLQRTHWFWLFPDSAGASTARPRPC